MGKDLRGKELGVGLIQEKSGLYAARFVDKFGKRHSKRFQKLQEARQWIAESTYIDQHSNISFPMDMITDAWFDYWIELKQKSVRPNTVKNYTERYYRSIQGVIGKMKLVDVKPMHCQKIFTIMADAGYRSGSINQTRVALYNMLELAKENEIITSNPCKKSVKSDIGKLTKKKEVLTIKAQREFLQGIIGQSYEDQFRFILQTGLRAGELIGLKWEDVDFKNKCLKIQRTMEYRYSTKEWRVGPPKSKSGYRTIPLTGEAVAILRRQKEKHNALKVIPFEWTEYVFLCNKGTPVKNSTYDYALKTVCDKVGIPRFSMHMLRHTFATRCIEAGMKPKTLQMILGHSNIMITMNLYVHTTEEEKAKEIKMIEDALMVV